MATITNERYYELLDQWEDKVWDAVDEAASELPYEFISNYSNDSMQFTPGEVINKDMNNASNDTYTTFIDCIGNEVRDQIIYEDMDEEDADEINYKVLFEAAHDLFTDYTETIESKEVLLEGALDEVLAKVLGATDYPVMVPSEDDDCMYKVLSSLGWLKLMNHYDGKEYEPGKISLDEAKEYMSQCAANNAYLDAERRERDMQDINEGVLYLYRGTVVLD